MTENEIGQLVIGAALKVHSAIGPGLLEKAYQACLAYEIEKRSLHVAREVSLPLRYEALLIDDSYRIDLLVENCVVVEVKAIEQVLPVHRGQVLSYLRLGGFKLGYLLNFNVAHMRDGITRLVNGL
jgi:GxxExxY protein